MPDFQLLSADIALGGDVMNVLHRGAFNPVTFPELLVIRVLHGEHSVTNVREVGRVKRTAEAEMSRLTTDAFPNYADLIKDKLFPGHGARLPTEDPNLVPSQDAPSQDAKAETPKASSRRPQEV